MVAFFNSRPPRYYVQFQLEMLTFDCQIGDEEELQCGGDGGGLDDREACVSFGTRDREDIENVLGE